MIYSSLLLAVQSTVPSTAAWSPKVALVMIACNLFAIIIGFYAIQNRGKGPALPVQLPGLFAGFGVPELLATASFGHLLGAGMILGLSNAGVL
ncbi:photosystem I reaction center subunit PsaK [Limnoraphis robusta]|uniref:Photosystem I reaction center subunit PsaK n=1 Tax=Limnoraphis robusta CCNP1315 TaxID=3110306 RepID=A0ABU5TS90_9CYAN|nr:photosystem I reaction center subunit PsaK [Limnoraphis robusta]MCG5057672.1 photosystem I reaction center subunit PsaK [Limnoraphis sp. WC205]MEA5496917.1 photosystem I reaction center subunit PsaK [Limnoraphis robusta BA-68 BA1]MEA5517742.1 photosystem I reaction center subunit PsaK [Limnoraphis robusta CCNP1315]MEA5546293.1 photosystem I reaction center subunit PsaK [Limnoraphis robusta CCNP1324]